MGRVGRFAAVVFLAAALVVPTAQASRTTTPSGLTQSFNVSLKRYKVHGHPTRAVKLQLVTTLERADGAVPPDITTQAFDLPAQIKMRPGAFRTCSTQTVLDSKGDRCPKGSRVGAGLAKGDARPIMQDKILAPLSVFNGVSLDKPVLTIFAVPNLGPNFASTLELTRTAAAWSLLQKPFSEPQTVPGVPIVPTTDFMLSLGAVRLRARGSTVGLLELRVSCSGELRFEMSATYRGGEQANLTDTVPCPR